VKIRQILITLTLGLGLFLGLAWVLGGASSRVRAAPGDVYCVTPGGGLYPPICNQVFTTVQAAVDAAGGGEEIRVAASTYADIHQRDGITQVVYISKTVAVRGGYTTTNGFAGPPDPVANPTTLDAGGQGRVVYITGTVPVTLEGLRLTNGSISGGGGGIRAVNARPVISGCQVCSNDASSGGGISLGYSDDAVLTGNQIYSNTATFNGGGVNLWHCGDATLTDNRVYSNTASQDGGGVVIGYSSNSTLVSNEVCSNKADAGGGVYVFYSPDARLTDNGIHGNMADDGSGGGACFLASNGAALTGNEICDNEARYDGGGIRLFGSGNATLAGNEVCCNSAAGNGGGIHLWSAISITLDANTVISNAAGYGGGICISDTTSARLVNNVVADNRKALFPCAGGIGIGDSTATLLHNTIARNWGFGGLEGSGVYVSVPTSRASVVTLTNNILVSHTVGISVTAGNTATLEGTLWGAGAWANITDTMGNGQVSTGTMNVRGAPAFVNPDGGDYHIDFESAAIDVGVDAGVDTDIDGEPRPAGAGYDLGADEYWCWVYLPLALRNT
jgi:fibronectin-binding autotransporter adhesin